MASHLTAPELLNSTQASEILGISISTLTRWIADGKIAATKLPGQTGAFVLTRAEVERVRREQDKAAAS